MEYVAQHVLAFAGGEEYVAQHVLVFAGGEGYVAQHVFVFAGDGGYVAQHALAFAGDERTFSQNRYYFVILGHIAIILQPGLKKQIMKTGKYKELSYKKIGDKYIIRIDPGGEVISLIKDFCTNEKVKLGTLHGLGAANKIEVGLFNVAEKRYYSNILEDDFEICPLYGNISQKDGETYIHCHINVSNIENKSFGGHCNQCHISATFECVLEVIDGEVGRRFDENIGLNIYDFE